MEREVRLGAVTGDQVAVMSGVQPGDVVVGEGSFYVPAERERLGLRPAPASAPAVAGSTTFTTPGTTQGDMKVQEATVTVTDASFDPQRLTLRAGVPARLTFI